VNRFEGADRIIKQATQSNRLNTSFETFEFFRIRKLMNIGDSLEAQRSLTKNFVLNGKYPDIGLSKSLFDEITK